MMIDVDSRVDEGIESRAGDGRWGVEVRDTLCWRLNEGLAKCEAVSLALILLHKLIWRAPPSEGGGAGSVVGRSGKAVSAVPGTVGDEWRQRRAHGPGSSGVPRQ